MEIIDLALGRGGGSCSITCSCEVRASGIKTVMRLNLDRGAALDEVQVSEPGSPGNRRFIRNAATIER